jgi:hypothetical protein
LGNAQAWSPLVFLHFELGHASGPQERLSCHFFNLQTVRQETKQSIRRRLAIHSALNALQRWFRRSTASRCN